MKKITLAISAFLVMPCFAESVQIPADKIITQIQAYDSYVYVHFSPSQSFNQGCSAPNTNSIAIDTSDTLGKNMYSAALSAATAKKKVGFGINGCHKEREKMYRIDVKF